MLREKGAMCLIIRPFILKMKTPGFRILRRQGKPGVSIMCQGIHMMKIVTGR